MWCSARNYQILQMKITTYNNNEGRWNNFAEDNIPHLLKMNATQELRKQIPTFCSLHSRLHS